LLDGLFDEKKVKEILQIPAEIRVLVLIAARVSIRPVSQCKEKPLSFGPNREI
jgi:hypothetical protein